VPPGGGQVWSSPQPPFAAPPAPAPQPGWRAPPAWRPQPSGGAKAALVLGIIGLVMPLASLVAIPIGLVAAGKISRSNGALTGKGQALAWVLLGGFVVVGLAALAALVTLIAPSGRSPSVALDAGDCVDLPTDDVDTIRFSADQVVGCYQPHVAEYAGSVWLPNPDGQAYPGEDAVFLSAIELCADLFDRYVGQSFADQLDLDMTISYPKAEAWRLAGDREIGCFIVAYDGSLLQQPVGS
jgi:hypothetical protein